MADVENDTEEGVSYTVEEGQGTGSFALFQPLEAGQVKSLSLMNEYFNILFYKRGEKEKPLAFKRHIHKDSSVKLRYLARNRWEVEVHPAGAPVGR